MLQNDDVSRLIYTIYARVILQYMRISSSVSHVVVKSYIYVDYHIHIRCDYCGIPPSHVKNIKTYNLQYKLCTYSLCAECFEYIYKVHRDIEYDVVFYIKHV
jgi:hypothetical protein